MGCPTDLALPSRRTQESNGRSVSQGAVGYLRRSTDRQEQSIPDQRKAIERYAAERGLELARFFVDDAISGTSATRRPAFQEMVGRSTAWCASSLPAGACRRATSRRSSTVQGELLRRPAKELQERDPELGDEQATSSPGT